MEVLLQQRQGQNGRKSENKSVTMLNTASGQRHKYTARGPVLCHEPNGKPVVVIVTKSGYIRLQDTDCTTVLITPEPRFGTKTLLGSYSGIWM